MRRGLRIPLLLASICIGSATHAASAKIDTQRQVFRDAYAAVERGDWAPAAANRSLLSDYVLWPDLRAAYLRTRLDKGENEEIRAFLKQYGTLKPARDLRYRFARQLAADSRYSAFLSLYEQFYQGRGVADLDCLALNAQIAVGKTEAIATRAEALWLIGKSQADECNPVFDYLRHSGQLGKTLYRERFVLARDARRFSLARYLARSIDEEYVAESNRWLSAQNSPGTFIQQADLGAVTPALKKQLVYALKTLAYREPVAAQQLWNTTESLLRFSPDQVSAVEQHIALWAARLNLPEADALLANLEDDAVNDEVTRWRIRTSLRRKAWQDVRTHINHLSAPEKQREEWQYWQAIALRQSGFNDESTTLLASLAKQRSYYGFLAADQLDRAYVFSQDAIERDATIIAELAANPSLIRARELFLVGLEGRGRSEWDAAIRNLDISHKRQAAVLAHRWGWHSRAIATAAESGDYADLELRYPLPHRESFELFSSAARIRESWAYSVARSESLFMRDIRSSAGAIGVMQLMPETGRRTAREISYPYKGRNTLTDPSSNIRLGTFYLGKMYQRFGEHTALATAAYNAGPLRVEAWMPSLGAVDARIWIENIPFNETRNYVRRVLAADAIFHWRLTGETRRVSSQLGDIVAGGEPLRIAAQ